MDSPQARPRDRGRRPRRADPAGRPAAVPGGVPGETPAARMRCTAPRLRPACRTGSAFRKGSDEPCFPDGQRRDPPPRRRRFPLERGLRPGSRADPFLPRLSTPAVLHAGPVRMAPERAAAL